MQAPPTSSSRLAVPPPDRVRVVYAELSSDDQRIHAKWSIIGGKNWETPMAKGPVLSLAGGYPLNASLRSGGCHTWEFDLDAQRVAGEWKWKAIAHGSNGKTARSEGTAARIEVLLDRDSEERIPCRVTVARIGDDNLVLDIPK